MVPPSLFNILIQFINKNNCHSQVIVMPDTYSAFKKLWKYNLYFL